MMLDELELLDDAAPPDADAAMLARVHGRAGRRRRRNRLAVSSACIVSLALVIGGVAVVRDTGHTVDVITPATTPTTPTNAITPAKPVSSTGLLPDGLDERMTVDHPAVVLGDTIEGRVTVQNNTKVTKTIGVGAIQCVLDAGPVLRDGHGKDVADATHGGVVCASEAQGIGPGASASVRFALPTDSVRFRGAPSTQEFWLGLEPILGKTVGAGPWDIGSVAIEIVSPDLSAHIELPTTTFTAGSEAKGTLVVVNPTNAVMHYTIDCNGVPPYDLLLAHDGVIFHLPQAGVGCLNTDLPQYGIGPGIHRFPFSVGMGYSMCGDGWATGGIPRCLPGGGAPPLTSGSYQIVYEGSGPFGSLEVQPVAIQVVVAPAK